MIRYDNIAITLSYYDSVITRINCAHRCAHSRCECDDLRLSPSGRESLGEIWENKPPAYMREQNPLDKVNSCSSLESSSKHQ